MADDSTQSAGTTEQLTRAVADRVLERMAAGDRERLLLEAVVENIPAGLVVVDGDGAPLVASREALRIFGKTDPADVAGWERNEAYRLDGTPVDPEDRPIARTLRTGEVVSGEVLEFVIDGRHAIFEISTAPVIGPSGERGGGISIFRDVTVRERTERAERDFVTNAAHELQSPLAAIVSAVEVLDAGAKDGPERDVFLGHIHQAADRLSRLVRALLILARSQTGVEAPRDELVAVAPLLHQVGAGLRLAEGVALEVECSDHLAVVTNRELVEQAVVNLAENAAKATQVGRIVLSARKRADNSVEIAVSDTGPGISPLERARVFERFYRADPGGSPGFGLGLAIVRAADDALKGDVGLDSKLGAGTVVRLRIPGAASLVSS
jgi:two-component system phosphate regulon sensor histidine kinase PhoR